MSLTPAEQANLLRVGTVEYVSPDKIEVVLDMDAPDRVAANAGIPRPFPRINSYVVIPTEGGSVVCQVEWVTIERSNFPKRKGFRDYGIVDLPFPLRKMRANPLGVLTADDKPTFRRGVDTFPTIGDPVLLPTDQQQKAVIESGEHRRLGIGTSPLAANAVVKVDPDRMFGRHLAVLGNTGSGKSCSVAGLIQWSLDAASGPDKEHPNARFIVLDPNGEYERVFARNDFQHKARIFRVGDPKRPLQVPLWFWNGNEWCSFTQASGKVQEPILRRALREIRAGIKLADDPSSEDLKQELRSYLTSTYISLRTDMRTGAIRDDSTKVGFKLKAVGNDLSVEAANYAVHGIDVSPVTDALRAALSSSYKEFPEKRTGKQVEYYIAFDKAPVEAILKSMETVIDELGGLMSGEGPSEDTPLPFDGSSFLDHIHVLGKETNSSQFIEYLVARIRTMLTDTRMRTVIGEEVHLTLVEWLESYIGGNEAANGCVTLVDLSLVPPEIVHLVTAVIARMTLEALQRYRRSNSAVLPTVLVMEEAHTFVRRYKEDDDTRSTASVCCRVFEKIAREGRKFGLGLVLSSQRPSELSQTVLSQCNTFLLHRISNDIDQERVSRLVPDNLRGLLRELPSLPSQHAILLGWASELPVLVRVNDLPEDQQPRSKDPDFWHVWTGFDDEKKVERPVNWQEIADEWQEKMPPAPKEGVDEDGDAAVDGAEEC